MHTFYGKILQTIFLWISISSLAIISIVAIADNDFNDRNSLTKSTQQYSYDMPIPSNVYLNKRYSEFLGGPGKRSYNDDNTNNNAYVVLPKRLSEFLGGPGKRMLATNYRFGGQQQKRLSEFLGGPGK
ncbi:uncharacterized protein LOC128954519 [Oppia nitens]|uniref:uncharacterized protein LOC128954519 n=1 Tax=Oppia nitens TaxID=1686743 RepID=UPI0023DBC833|nr:uncharacterized protein LOC128954519 [Oppia nitens]